ncbi:MAG: hypothetical protein H6581_23195 [Bacteroidia bacterium]|nr:hypothetical protein [Bacteroidia bacterium]
MQKLLFFLILWVILPGFVSGQNMVFVGSGLNVSYVAPDSLNFVTRRFNETRGVLSHNLPPFHLPIGMNFEFGVLSNRILYDLSWVGRTQTSHARFSGSGFLEEFHLKLRMNSLNLGLGYSVVSAEKVNLVLGASVDAAFVKVLYRYGPTPDVKSYAYDPVVSKFALGNTIFAQLLIGVKDGFGACAVIRPYFQFQWTETDFFPVNQAINPGTWFSDPRRLGSRVNNFGISVTGVYYFAVVK